MNYNSLNVPLDQIEFKYTEEEVRLLAEDQQRAIERLERLYAEEGNYLPLYKSYELTAAKITKELLVGKLRSYKKSDTQLRKAARHAFADACYVDILSATDITRKSIVLLARQLLNYSEKTSDNDVWNPLRTIALERARVEKTRAGREGDK